MIPADDPVSLSRLFHLNSEPWLNEQAYQEAPFLHEYKIHNHTITRVFLPRPSGGHLTKLFSSRRSVRAFADKSVSVATLSQLLLAAYGVVDITSVENGGAYLRRSVPSAGALYPLELYVLLRRVDGLENGIYAFEPRNYLLDQLSGGESVEKALGAFYTYPFIGNANIIICHAAVFARSQKKYGPRGYRYILLEAGHSAQNLCLAAAEIGLGTLCMGGFKDGELNKALGLLPPAEGVVYSVAVGNLPAP